MNNAIIIGHFSLPNALFDTLESIVGKLEGIVVISNKGLSSDKLCNEIKQAVTTLVPEKTVIFVDVPGGSCAISCLSILKEDKKIPVICGVNLPILLEFFVNRDKHSRDKLVEILVEKGRKSIGILGA